MAERHVSFEQITDIMAFRVLTASPGDCYKALGVLHQTWQMIPGRFKDYISTPKSNGYRSLHTALIYENSMRMEVQIRTRDMHRTNEFGLAAHWAYKQGERPDGQVGWLRDLIEIVDASHDAEELLEHTRLAIYQDRIFAFTPKGALHQLPKGATPIDFAYAVHTDLGDQTVGAKINGRMVPLRTVIENGDSVQILRSKAQEPQSNWLNFAVTGKAQAAIRRHLRHKEREGTLALGAKLYDDIVARLPVTLSAAAVEDALKRLGLSDENALRDAIANGKLDDEAVIEALMPGTAAGARAKQLLGQRAPILIEGLTPGVAFDLAEDCRPVPGDRIVALRKPGGGIEVHAISCPSLADRYDADWIDVAWGDGAEGGTARIAVTLKNEPGALGAIATIIGAHKANILGLRLDNRDTTFHTNTIDLEVRDATHLMRLLAALRAADVVNAAQRIDGSTQSN